MYTKKVTFSPEARQWLYTGVQTLAKAVGSTLGPKGSTVIIDTSFPVPTITKDGVTVAKNIFLEDKIENMGAQIVKQAAAKTAEQAGDGTTTATILAEAIIRHGLQAVEQGVPAIQIKEQLEFELPLLVKQLQEWSTPVKDIETLRSVATISANNDDSIGNLMAAAYEAIGTNGVIAIKESKTNESFIELVKGMEFDRGFLSPYFINNASKLTCELENPFILTMDSPLRDIRDLAPILDKVHANGSSILIIAPEVEAQALNLLVINAVKAGLKACAVKAPAFGERQKEILQDIAILTGGLLFSQDTRTLLKDATLDQLGRAGSATIGMQSTTIVNGAGSKESVQERIEFLKTRLEATDSEWQTEKFQERIAKLSDGIAVLHVGASTESELKEKKDRIDDALRATKAAIQEGYLPGGGIPLLHLSNMMSQINPILSKALAYPFEVICENAAKDPAHILSEINRNVQLSPELESDIANDMMGYDAKNDVYTWMSASNIIDPTKVVRVALENAISVANLILMTSTTIHPTEPTQDLSRSPLVDDSYYDQP